MKNQNKSTMINRGYLLRMILILTMGGILLIGCDKNDDEELLDASRPIFNMLFPISEYGLNSTEWYGRNGSGNLVITFDRTTCTFTVTDFVSDKKTTTAYAYKYNHPVVTLTPVNENESIVVGKTISGRELADDEMSFVDEKDAPVWMRVFRKK